MPVPVSGAPSALDAPVYVIADAHLGVTPPDLEDSLWSFLAHVRDERGALVMNGDMFEFWFEWGHVVPHVGVRLLAACAAIAERGLPVLWIIGNHDCWGGDVLRAQSGASYLDGPWTGTLAGWRAHIAHGDGLRPELDRGYRALRAVIRHPWAVRVFRLLHPDWGAALARATSHTSRNVRPRDGGEGLRTVAHQTLAADPTLDVVVYGHTHIAMLERKSRETGIYANPGAWLNEPTFLKFTAERVSLCRWDGAREIVTASIDRSAP
ncbi:MAG: UDP-2,3-diacylglucosamine diphosphatase [Gemmatimonadetes bacterium]|nr:UDP-2,3-diacylglucosamine diphosphatase [Gemmatimonadota bacterium]